MNTILILLKQYRSAKSRVSFYNWLNGEYDSLAELMDLLHCNTLTEFKKICICLENQQLEDEQI